MAAGLAVWHTGWLGPPRAGSLRKGVWKVSRAAERRPAGGGRITCVLNNNPGGNDGQDQNVGLSGTTRLGRIIGEGQRQLFGKLNDFRKDLPVKIFLVLLGFYSANALATVLGQTGDWDVLAAGVMVAVIEGIGYVLYRKPAMPMGKRLQSLFKMLNYWKAGFSFGLFVDAFKLGS